MTGLEVSVEFEVPENKTVVIPEKVIRAAMANSIQFAQGELRFDIAYILDRVDSEYPNRYEKGVTDPLVGATRKHKLIFGEDLWFNRYLASALIELPEAKNYRVVLPEMRINW